MRFSHLGPSRCLTISAGIAFPFLRTAPDRGTAPPSQLKLTWRRRQAGHGLVSGSAHAPDLAASVVRRFLAKAGTSPDRGVVQGLGRHFSLRQQKTRARKSGRASGRRTTRQHGRKTSIILRNLQLFLADRLLAGTAITTLTLRRQHTLVGALSDLARSSISAFHPLHDLIDTS